jgi:hypothetical protein
MRSHPKSSDAHGFIWQESRDIESRAIWANTDNVKAQNQSVVNVEDPTDHHIADVKGTRSITGRDSESILGVKNCPGGGHGELTLQVS